MGTFTFSKPVIELNGTSKVDWSATFGHKFSGAYKTFYNISSLENICPAHNSALVT